MNVQLRMVPAAAAALLLAACASTSTAEDPAAEPPAPADVGSMIESEPMVEPEPTTPAPADDPLPPDGSTPDAVKQRCIDTTLVMERRIEEEGFEFPDEDEAELTEAELETMLVPAVEVDDGVAAPDERPELAPMPDFDPETAPIPQLDALVGACFEAGIVTDEDVFGEESAEEVCAELTELPVEEIREFAEEEGADLVRAEFEACGLPDPLATQDP